MGWLFGCFGYTKKRKRPKKASKFGPKSRRIRSYQPLQSEVLQELGVSELSRSVLVLRNDPKEEKKAKIRKKVRFNLEVIAYEPIPDEDSSSNLQEDEGDTNWEMTEEESSSSHRYTNCYDDEDEDDHDDAECGISDLDDDDEDDYDDGDCLIDPQKIYYEEISEEYQDFCLPLTTSGDTDLGTIDGSTRNVRFRSHYIVPVLNPIENISQWKALKGKKKLIHT